MILKKSERDSMFVQVKYTEEESGEEKKMWITVGELLRHFLKETSIR